MLLLLFRRGLIDYRRGLINCRDQMLGFLDVGLRTLSESPEIGERDLGIGARIGQTALAKQRYRDIVTRSAGAEQVASFVSGSNALPIMVQGTVDISRIVVDHAQLIVHGSAFDDSGCRYHIEALFIQPRRFAEVAADFLNGACRSQCVKEAPVGDLTELGKTYAAAERIAGVV